MNQNLEKFTKAELISKLEKLNKKELQNSIKSENSKSEVSKSVKNEPIKIWDLILEILSKFRSLFLSLSVVAILIRIFKNYKSIRAILKVANYVILALFGMSLYEAFGLAFIVKIFGEIKNISTAVMVYLTESTFYQYLGSIFNISKEDQSVRDKYKNPVEYDWKAEYEKEQRKREWDEWRNRNIYNKHDNEDNREINTNLIIVTILALGGSIAIWYYGKDALDILTPIWNLGTLITGILRGEGPDDGNNNNLAPPAPPAPVAPPAPPAPPMPSTPQDIELVDKKGDNRPESPDAMMVYASDMVNRNVAPTGPTETTPSNSESIRPTETTPSKSESITKDGKIIKPPLSKNEAKPMNLLESLKEGKKLKHTPIESKDKSKRIFLKVLV